MKKLYTVKEVCELTGLNRKLLYDYKEENIVIPFGYSNVGFDDHDGYKLYDEDAVLKLQQIAIFRKLAMKRADIKEKMTADDYDSNAILDEQLEMLKLKKKEIEDMILIAEQLKLLGTKNRMITYFNKSSISEITEANQRWLESSCYKNLVDHMQDNADAFENNFEQLSLKIKEHMDMKYDSDEVYDLMQEEFETFSSKFGLVGAIILVIIAAAGVSDGTLASEMFGENDPNEVKFMSDALIAYAHRRFDEMFDEVVQIIVKNIDIIGDEYSDPQVLALFEILQKLCKKYLGISSNEEYQAVFEFLPDRFFGSYDKVLYLVDVVKHFTGQQ